MIFRFSSLESTFNHIEEIKDLPKCVHYRWCHCLQQCLSIISKQLNKLYISVDDDWLAMMILSILIIHPFK